MSAPTSTPRLREIAADIRPHVYVAIAAFLAGAVFGVLVPRVSLARMEVLKAFAESLRGASALDLIFVIFVRNASAAVMSIGLGIFFGVFSAV